MSSPRVWKLWTPDAVRLADRAEAVLSSDEARRARAFHRDRDRQRYVVAHVWLRLLLGELLDVAPARVPIEAGSCAHCGGPHGKPQLPADTGLHFSLSRSADVALCAVADAPVGIDVEAVPPDSRHLDLMAALDPGERTAVRAAPVAARALAFTQCWARKEAYLKGTGEGLSREPQAVRVGVGSRFDDPGPTAGELGGWRLVDLDAPPGYAAAMAVCESGSTGCEPLGRGDGIHVDELGSDPFGQSTADARARHEQPDGSGQAAQLVLDRRQAMRHRR